MAKKILIIDDEKIVSFTLKRLLKKSGYDVIVSSNGNDALQKIKKHTFNLIISDVRMPKMDGIEVIKEIRKYLESINATHIPEVLITGYADLEKYESAMNLEVADYLNKPFENNEFLKIVEKNIK